MSIRIARWNDLPIDDGRLSRRDFLQRAGRTAAGLYVLGGIAACAGGEGGAPTSPAAKVGAVRGSVVDIQGAPLPGLGVLILMESDGRHTGARATPDASGGFAFENLAPGDYQVRFHADGAATIPAPYLNPIRFTVVAGQATDITFRVERGAVSQNQVEIYCGDDFYQLQPDGVENGETVVRLGTLVCWYNVGRKIHTVTGGPWKDSGDLQKSQSYDWVAGQVGFFPYRCSYYQPLMQASLRVTA